MQVLSNTLVHLELMPYREYWIKSVITYAGFHALSIVQYRTVSPGHQRSDRSCNNRERTGACLPSLAVCLWSPLQVYAFACRIRPLLHTCFAVLPGRGH